jgi:hypothetical protein
MDAILFLHHRHLRDPVTCKHLALIRALNPGSEVIPLCFELNRETPQWQWRNCDLLALEWFDREQPKHERFFILEWDCFCSQPLKEFYGAAYERPVVASVVVNPWSTAMVPGEAGETFRMRDYPHFQANESGELYPHLRGLLPVCGVMLRHEVFFNMVQLWKTVAGFDRLFSEARLGTLAVMAGCEPEVIRPDCWKYIFSKNRDFSLGPGVYHRIQA